MPRNALLKPLRLIHLYFGVFISPAILFFAFTGALQTFGLHETNRDHPAYTPPRWAVVLGQLHKKQTTIVPVRRQPPPQQAGQTTAADATQPRRHRDQSSPTQPATALAAAPVATPASPPSPAQPTRHPLPLRIFFLVVSIGLFTSTLTGLYMTYSYVRNKPLVTAILVAGIILPLILIFV